MKYLQYVPSLIMFAIIWYFSSQPSLQSDFIPMVDFFLRKWAHILEYMLLYLSLFFIFVRQNLAPIYLQNWNIAHIYSFTISFMVALSDEWHQTWVFGREGTPKDIVFDSIGFLLAYTILYLWYIFFIDTKDTKKDL